MSPDNTASPTGGGLPPVNLADAFAPPSGGRGVSLPPATRPAAPRRLTQVPDIDLTEAEALESTDEPGATGAPDPADVGASETSDRAARDSSAAQPRERRPSSARRQQPRPSRPTRSATPEPGVDSEQAQVVGTYVSQSGRAWLNERATAQGDNVTNVVLDALEDTEGQLREKFASTRRQGESRFGARRAARPRHPEPQVALALRLTPSQVDSLDDFQREVGAPNRTRLITVAVDLARGLQQEDRPR